MSSISQTPSWTATWAKRGHEKMQVTPPAIRVKAYHQAMSQSTLDISSMVSPPEPIQRIFFSPHPDDIAYSAFGTASNRPAPRCCHHDNGDESRRSSSSSSASGISLLSSGFEAIPSPSLSSSSRFSDDATLVGSAAPSPALSPSTFSRRNSSISEVQNALIVTVFSKSRCANGEIGERLQRNVDATTLLRTDEDEAFARSIGCDLLQLGFPDSSARDEPSRRPDLAQLAMSGKPGQKLRHVDHAIYEEVRQALEPIVGMAVRAGAKIHLPLGVGCHVDHWMVRVAVLSILDELDDSLKIMKPLMTQEVHNLIVGGTESLHERLIFYEDLPYADAQTNEHIERLALSVLPHGAKAQLIHLSESAWCKKRAAILAYASQMKPTIVPSLYNHATRLAQLGKAIDPDWDNTNKRHLAAERIWIIDAELRRMALESSK